MATCSSISHLTAASEAVLERASLRIGHHLHMASALPVLLFMGTKDLQSCRAVWSNMAEEVTITVKWLLQELQRLETKIVAAEEVNAPGYPPTIVERLVKEKLAVWQCLTTVQAALITERVLQRYQNVLMTTHEEVKVKWLLQKLQRLENKIVAIESINPPGYPPIMVERLVKEKLAVWHCLTTVQAALISTNM